MTTACPLTIGCLKGRGHLGMCSPHEPFFAPASPRETTADPDLHAASCPVVAHGYAASTCDCGAPEPSPRETTAAPDLDALRLAYANACERMGMAHANGTRAEWLAAVDAEIATRRDLNAALSSALARAREEALTEAADAIQETSFAERFMVAQWLRARSVAPADPGERIAVLTKALEDARAALDRDRTGLAAALNAILDEVKGRRWMRPEGDGDEGGTWGAYDYREHTQATLRKEIGWAFDAISRHATGALVASGKLADAEVRKADEAITGRRRALSPEAPCGCSESYPQLVRGQVSHGPGCAERTRVRVWPVRLPRMLRSQGLPRGQHKDGGVAMIYELYRGGGKGTFRLRGDVHVAPVARNQVLDAVVEVPDGEEEDAFYWLRQTNPRPMNEMPDFGAWREVCARRGVHMCLGREQKGIVSDPHGPSRGALLCLGCGELPPHTGSETLCPACAPPNGSCSCPGCALVQPYRDRLEALAEEARGMCAMDPTEAPSNLLALAMFAERGLATETTNPDNATEEGVMAKRRYKDAKVTPTKTVGYGYVGTWSSPPPGGPGWFMPRHLTGDPYAAEAPAEDPNCAGEMFVLCRITVEVIPGARRRRVPTNPDKETR